MSLIDIFKKKPEEEKKQPEVKKTTSQKKIRTKKEKAVSEPKIAKASETVLVPKHKNEKSVEKSGEMAWVLQSPQISEKAGFLAESNQYIFRVSKRANKTEVKKAIESTFGINVASVRIINVPGKERKVGGKIGFKKGYKKAIVKIKEGQKIEVLPR